MKQQLWIRNQRPAPKSKKVVLTPEQAARVDKMHAIVTQALRANGTDTEEGLIVARLQIVYEMCREGFIDVCSFGAITPVEAITRTRKVG